MKTIKKLSAKAVLELLPYDISMSELQDLLVSDIAHVFVSEQDDIGDVLVEGAHFVPNEGGYIYTGMHIIVPQTTNEDLARKVTLLLSDQESKAAASDNMSYKDLIEASEVSEDGLDVLSSYIEKYFKNVRGKANLKEALESFENDVTQYALPAIHEMLKMLK